MIRLQALVIAVVLAVAGVRVATYTEHPPPPRPVELWQRLVAARSARAAMSVQLRVAGRVAVDLTATGVVETAARRASLRVERNGTTYDAVVTGVFVYVRPRARDWYSYVLARETPDQPFGLLGLLAEAPPLHRRGSEPVGGVPTARYTTPMRDGFLDVWVDRDGLPRRVAFVQGGSSHQIELSDFFVAEPVAVPLDATPVSGLAEALRQ